MYTSTYEMEKLAELRHHELMLNAERNRILRVGKKQKKRAVRNATSPTCLTTESTCNGCA